MALLRFTNPIDYPCYRNWDIVVYAAQITLLAEDMRDVYEACLELVRRSRCKIPKKSGRYAESSG